MPIKHSVVIIGSGPIGLSAALLFAKSGIDVAIIIKQERIVNQSNNPARLFALAHSSYKTLKQVVNLDSKSQTINHIRIVDNNSCAKVDFAPSDINLDNFGSMIDEYILTEFLYSRLLDNNIKIYKSEEDLVITEKEFFITIKSGQDIINTPLIVAADGKYSSIRKKFSIPIKEYNYNETAIVIDIRHSTWPHGGVAIEKFTPNGPFAILPKYEENGSTSSIVWVTKGQCINLNSLSKDVIRDLIMEKLDDYLGDIELISEPITYNLKLIQSSKRFSNRVVFVGDAAQSIHPIAGQGFNLGLRDISDLITTISTAIELGLDYGSYESLNRYSKLRDSDVAKMISATSLINALFSNDISLLKIIRRLGLNVFDKIPTFKRMAMRYAAGI